MATSQLAATPARGQHEARGDSATNAVKAKRRWTICTSFENEEGQYLRVMDDSAMPTHHPVELVVGMKVRCTGVPTPELTRRGMDPDKKVVIAVVKRDEDGLCLGFKDAKQNWANYDPLHSGHSVTLFVLSVPTKKPRKARSN